MAVPVQLSTPDDYGPWHRHPFVTYLARGGPLTRRQRRYRGEQLASWLSGGRHNALSFPWADVKYEQLVAVRAGLVQRYAPGTANGYLAILKGVLKECWRLGLVKGEDYRRIVDVPGVPDDRPLPGRDVQVEELKAMLRTMQEEGSLQAVRDAAVVVTLYGTGMRRAELCQLRLGDYDPHDTSFLVRGKGGRDRITYGPDWVRDSLAAWLELRGDTPGALFVNVMWGRIDPAYAHLSPNAVYRLIIAWTRKADLPHITTHDWRRTHIGDMFDAGVDIATIGRNVGQKTPSVTARYDRRGNRTKRDAVNKLLSPF